MYVMPLVHPYMLRVRTRLHIHAPSKPFNLAAQHTFGRQYDSDQNYRAFHQIADWTSWLPPFFFFRYI